MTSEVCTCVVFTNSNHCSSIRRHRATLLLFVVALACLAGPSVTKVRAQDDDPLHAIGIPSLSGQIPVQNGSINVATGNLHLEFPLVSIPQRGGLSLKYMLTYDSNIWMALNWGNFGWASPGWNLTILGGNGYANSNFISHGFCDADQIEQWDEFMTWYWTDPNGNTHYFPIHTEEGNATSCHDDTYRNVPTGDALAIDGSGYHMYVKDFINVGVFAPDGTCVNGTWVNPTDINGNYGFSSSRGTDTLGRVPVTITTTGNTETLSILNSGKNGGTSSYTITVRSINYYSNFKNYYPTPGTFNGIQSIQLPDGTSYSFTYDSGTTLGNYGQLTSMTLPTGGTINYSYANFLDSEFLQGGTHVTRMISTMTTPDGQWTFTPAVIIQCTASSQTNCQQQLTVSKPAYNGRNDTAVYKSIINGGAWPIEADYYTGAVSPANLIASITQSFDLSHPCPYTGAPYYLCSYQYAIFVTKLATTITLPTPSGTNVHQTTQYCHDINYGNLLYKWEWNFYTSAIVHDPNPPANCSLYSGSTPDRTTTFTYLSGSNYLAKNIYNRPASVTVTNSGGITIAKTLNSYDGSPLVTAGATGVVYHDDANYGAGNRVRGNLTQVQRLISGTSNYLTKSMTYDITGQMRT